MDAPLNLHDITKDSWKESLRDPQMQIVAKLIKDMKPELAELIKNEKQGTVCSEKIKNAESIILLARVTLSTLIRKMLTRMPSRFPATFRDGMRSNLNQLTGWRIWDHPGSELESLEVLRDICEDIIDGHLY